MGATQGGTTRPHDQTVKILCWNMGAAFGPWREGPALHERAWLWIAALDPDLPFLQGCAVPPWAKERWTILTPPFQFGASALVAKPALAPLGLVPGPGSLLGRFGSASAVPAFREAEPA